MLYTKEIKNIEVGQDASGVKISVNGKQIDKHSHPNNYALVQAVRKDFSDIFTKIGTEFNVKYPDITIDGNKIILKDENGKVLVDTTVDKTNNVKSVLGL